MAENMAGEPHVTVESHVTDLLGLYYLDALDEADGARIERHLVTCPACRAAAQEAIETVAALEMLAPADRAELSGAHPGQAHDR